MSNQREATRVDKAEDRAYLDEPKQPILQGGVPKLSESRRVDDVRFFPPIFPINGTPQQTQILAIGISPTPEEASSVLSTQHAEHYQKPRLLKGPLGQILKDVIDRFPGLHSDKMTYATAIPWLLPKARRFRPNKDELEWTKGYLRELVNWTKPTVIVAFGKLVFDQLVDIKISADDARGGWFDCNGIPIYLMEPAHQMVTQPWTLSTVMDDFKEVARMVSIRDGTSIPEEPVRSQEIRTLEQLKELVANWEKFNYTLFAVDNEWKGANFVDGNLRSTQFAWTDLDGAYLNFFNEHGEPILGRTQNLTGERLWNISHWVEPEAFYVDYKAVGAILQPYLNRQHIRYIGHYFSADSTWMERWLGLKVHGRCLCDTAFALQTTNEYAPQGLERLALQVTNFGRYDIPLALCKKELKITKGEGYGRIPDSVLVPYGVLDVIVPFRAWPYLEAELKRQGTLTYFHNIVMPLVSDTFHTFALTGLPVDRELFEATRKFMNWAYRELLKDFLESMAAQADQLMSKATGVPEAVLKHMRETNAVGARNWLLTQFPLSLTNEVTPIGAIEVGPIGPSAPESPVVLTQALMDHWENIASFNIRSGPVMTRWLFDVMHLTPVKSTGKPSMTWDKVQTLPPAAQKAMKPAADKETIEILAEIDTSGLLPKLLNLSNVGNICKGFLKEGTVDQDGEVVKENGLAQFIASDGCIHCLWSLTETSRPRTFLPNVLNLSKYLNKYIFRGLLILLDKVEIPQEFEVLFGSAEEREGMSLKDLIKERVPSVRSVVKAVSGWCLVESDYRTAEIRGQGFISGDAALIELMVGKDKSFALHKGKPVRLFFQKDTKIYPENQDQNLLMAWCEEGKEPIPLKPSDLDRDENGELLHPSYDLHWSLAEDLTGKPREVLNSDIDRGRGKTGNFSGAYLITPGTLERRLEASTGIKPPEGTGQAILDSLEARQPVSVQYIRDVSRSPPKSGTLLQAQSGRIRHFPVHSAEIRDMPWRVAQGILRAMGNEAANFLYQESVAATLAKACKWLNDFFLKHGMKARCNMGLYDSCVTLCPLEERWVVDAAHTLFMDRINVWCYHRRYMSYPIDTDFVYRWSWKPTKAQKAELHDKSFHQMEPEREKNLLAELANIEKNFFDAQPWILQRLNVV